MNQWKSVALLLLVFCSGIAVGVVGTRAVVRRMVQQAMVHPERVQAQVERNLKRGLRLDADQQLQLRAILVDTRKKLGDLRKEFQPQTVAVLSAADQKIAALLRPEQLARYQIIKDRAWPALRRLQAETPAPEPPPAP